jgi:hypothetical protein
MILDKPFFMSNESWYTWNEHDFRYELTEEAPLEAVNSYKEFYEILDNRFILDE